MRKAEPLILLLLVLSNFNCGKDNPVKPENRSPIIFSLTVFPDTIRTTDSALVVCNAMDPDADTLVYDWITDGRLRIKGTVVCSLSSQDWCFEGFTRRRFTIGP